VKKAPPRVPEKLCIVGLVGAFFFSGIWAFPYYNRVTIHRDREKYQSQSFIVRNPVYVNDTENGDSYWLEGWVNGQEERLIPNRRIRSAPRSSTELKNRYPQGTTIPVLYNPEGSKTFVQRESTRVMEATPDFWEQEAARRTRLACDVFLPVPLALALYLGVRFVGRRRERSA